MVERVGEEIGLKLNEEKTEVICRSQEARESLLSSLPETKDTTQLGSPIGGVSAISTTLRDKVDALKIMGGRLAHLATHDTLLLLKHSFDLPKLLYCLRTAPCFLSPSLQEYDNHLKVIVIEITNIHFFNESPNWSQATLPVRSSGLGIRSTVQIAPSAYLVSTAASTDVVHCIVPTHLRDVPLPNCDEAEAQCSKGYTCAAR